MKLKVKKRPVKRKSDMRKITVSIPGKLYYMIKDFAQDEIRTVSQQARLFMEIGIQVASQQPSEQEPGQEVEEKQPCIGFHVDSSGDDDE